MSAERIVLPRDEYPGSDLCAIHGLGEKTAKALPMLGISSCADLAQYLTQHTAEDLSNRLAEQGVQIRAKQIENQDWLGQARKRAGRPSTEPAKPKPEGGTAEEGEKANPSGHPPIEVRFGVIFRREQDHWTVTTYDERRNGPEKVWGIEPAEWANWILRRMELPLPEVEAAAPPAVGIGITDVQAYEAERFKKLAVKVHFVVSGSKKGALAAAHTPFWIHVHTADLVSGTISLVASEQGRFEPEKFDYLEELRFPIPEVGRYQVQTLVLLLPPVGTMALYEGPTFQVVP